MKIPQDKLYNAARNILIACGENEQGASDVAECMLKADMRGITTHGTYLLTPIYKRMQAHQLALPTQTTVAQDRGATATIDGGDGLGAIAGRKACDLAVAKAKEFGIATVLIRNTNNIGMLANYTEQAAREGMIAFMCCNAAPAMAPWGGSEQYIGTNPIAMAIYTGQDLIFSADMATSVVARGKIRKAARNGTAIPSDWALDEDGNITTDPNAALKGCLLPMGGPKGSAIALTVDLFAGMLSGSRYANDLKSFHAPEGSTGVGAALVVINIDYFMQAEEFSALMAEYIKKMKGLKKAQGTDAILLPGELEQMKEAQSRDKGVELDEGAVQAINELLKNLNIYDHNHL